MRQQEEADDDDEEEEEEVETGFGDIKVVRYKRGACVSGQQVFWLELYPSARGL
jgi:hypothetical protein